MSYTFGMKFKFVSKFRPKGDQPKAIKELASNLENGIKHQVLLGVTGSGKTFTMAKIIEKTQRPTLIISHNKTLAAQLYQEFKDFFPRNSIHYFVSYYDYYQPEAYIPQTDTYIEKDSKVNQEIDRLRHDAVQAILQRRDIIIIASVSCIYNIGSPEIYQGVSLEIKKNQKIERKEFLRSLSSLQYQRNDIDFLPGTFRVRGEIVETNLATGRKILRVEFFKNTIKSVSLADPSVSPKFSRWDGSFQIFPAHFWVSPQNRIDVAIKNIKTELEERLKELKKQKLIVEEQRLRVRTNNDLEMMKETGWCHGIENYSRHLEFREEGEAPFSLIDYFPKDFLTIIDESHITISQIQGMYNGDKARKNILIKYGFRLPSALDNRPLKFGEFEDKINQTVYVSATPGFYEKEKSKGESGKPTIIEQLIRPTGLLEPKIEIKPTKNQIKHLIGEIEKRVKIKERILVVTLTKRMAEALADHLSEKGIKTRYLHSEIKTLERPEILRGLRVGKYDVLVGINLLREGLDLPEVSLIAILDADKEGFLRNATTLIQTMGRASRHPNGQVLLYADKMTDSMKRAINEVERRRKIQISYNKKHGVTPKPIIKGIRDWNFGRQEEELSPYEKVHNLTDFKKTQSLEGLKKEMKKAARDLNFEKAAELRDLIKNWED